MLRKSGGNREPTPAAKVLSVLPKEHHAVWFGQVWDGPPGASTRHHPAPFPVEIAERLVRMFSFVGDTILDRITGTAKMQVVVKRWERNRIRLEIDPGYARRAEQRISNWDDRKLHSHPIYISKSFELISNLTETA